MIHRTGRPKSGLRWSNWSSTSQTDIIPNEPIKIKNSKGNVSRPTTAVQARPEIIDSARPKNTIQPLQRPGSAVRPLSGNVFMRRSSKRGWVAKAYPEQHSSSSQPNLDVEHFTSSRLDSESLDSFFDDEFEEQDQGEKLGMLLACNTLGVESKATKQDWISGEIDIPQFHCPRCRDHWYGVRTEPCDEELARLIREGLWKTGNTSKDTNQRAKYRGGSFNLKSSDRDLLSTSSSKTKLPSLKHGQFRTKLSNSSSSNWEMRRPDETERQRKKKRITFQLNEDDSGSGSQLDLDSQEGMSGRRSWRKTAGNEEEGVGGRSRGSGAGGASGGEDSEGRGMRGGGGVGGGAVGGDSTDGNMGDDSEASRRRRKKTGLHGEDGDNRGQQLSGEEGDGEKSSGRGKRGHLRGAGITGNAKGGESSDRGHANNTSEGANSTGLGGRGGLGANQAWGSGYGSSGGMEGGHGDGANVLNRSQDGGRGSESQGGEGTSLGTGNQDNNDTTGLEGGGASNQRAASNKQSGTNKKTTTTTGNAFNKPIDHGKRVRKSGGYMRAVSPTSSEWGDPLHARSFISSTATSRMGSNTDLTNEKDDEEGQGYSNIHHTGRGKKFLPPIVHPITRPPPVATLDLMGPALTRPWTFSYH